MFYIVYAGIYWVYTSLKQHKINWRFFSAIFLLGFIFLLTEYRLVYAMFFDQGFISHRIEFDVFFNADLFETYRLSLVKFLQGHIPHAAGLQQLYLIPTATIALLMSFSHHRFTKSNSMIIWLLIILTFVIDIWNDLLVNRYSMPIILTMSILVFIYNKQKIYRHLALTLIGIIMICLMASTFQYQGFKWITEYVPLFKSLNVVRLYLVEPLLLLVLITVSFEVYFRKLHYTSLFLLIFVLTQFVFSYDQSFYSTKQKLNYLTFNQYYAPETFNQLKDDISKAYPKQKLEDFRFISYGIEPAVALFNGFYTVDGYCTNYPLSYKKRFRKTQAKILELKMMKGNKKLYDDWGSKVYLIGLDSRVEHYKYFVKNEVPAVHFNANIDGICSLGTDFIISSHPLKNIDSKPLRLWKNYRDEFWRIWVYKIVCKNK
jgi:hypothetical protein